jgi:hypothetical protein
VLYQGGSHCPGNHFYLSRIISQIAGNLKLNPNAGCTAIADIVGI